MEYLALSPEQQTALSRMYVAMEDMHTALFTGTTRALEFPYPLYLSPTRGHSPALPDGHSCVYWVQGNWAREMVESFTLDLDTLVVTVRIMEPYVFFALDKDQQVAILHGEDPQGLCGAYETTVDMVVGYVNENVDTWTDMALDKLAQDLEG